ncbi:MAG TPA: hypothetical protein VE871_14210 [Longimicrobium sp.]|nr:hypothetical protein [Longimicrobium sp.]
MRRRGAAVLAMCWLAACGDSGGDSPDAGNATAEVGTLGTSTDGGAAANGGTGSGMPVQPIPRPEQTIAAGTLTQVNNSGVGGSMNLRGIGQQTEVSLNVTGLTEANRQLQAFVVQGRCAQSAGGPEVGRIGPILMGTGNVAALTDTLAVPPATVLNGQNALLIKGQNSAPSTPPLACADLPDWQRLPPTS